MITGFDSIRNMNLTKLTSELSKSPVTIRSTLCSKKTSSGQSPSMKSSSVWIVTDQSWQFSTSSSVKLCSIQSFFFENDCFFIKTLKTSIWTESSLYNWWMTEADRVFWTPIWLCMKSSLYSRANRFKLSYANMSFFGLNWWCRVLKLKKSASSLKRIEQLLFCPSMILESLEQSISAESFQRMWNRSATITIAFCGIILKPPSKPFLPRMTIKEDRTASSSFMKNSFSRK